MFCPKPVLVWLPLRFTSVLPEIKGPVCYGIVNPLRPRNVLPERQPLPANRKARLREINVVLCRQCLQVSTEPFRPSSRGVDDQKKMLHHSDCGIEA
jgi:hypothetical protein